MFTSEVVVKPVSVSHRWGWFLFSGILMLLVGTLALIVTPAATLGTIIVFGWLLVLSGIVECIHAFQIRKWAGFLLYLLGGALGLVVGLLVVTHPVSGALAWTLLFAAYFTVIGIFRFVAVIGLRFPEWGWAAFDALVTLVLGVLLWVEWPSSAVWFIGLAVGISMILRGWSYIIFAFANRRLMTLMQEPVTT